LRDEGWVQLKVGEAEAQQGSSQATLIDTAYSICGSDVIFESNPLQRRFQDAHAITQQHQDRMAYAATAGQHYLGLEPEPRMF